MVVAIAIIVVVIVIVLSPPVAVSFTKVEIFTQDEVARLNSELSLKSNGRMKHVVPKGGKLKGGTLIVCPTSLIRQWAHEIAEKVSKVNTHVNERE